MSEGREAGLPAVFRIGEDQSVSARRPRAAISDWTKAAKSSTRGFADEGP